MQNNIDTNDSIFNADDTPMSGLVSGVSEISLHSNTGSQTYLESPRSPPSPQFSLSSVSSLSSSLSLTLLLTGPEMSPHSQTQTQAETPTQTQTQTPTQTQTQNQYCTPTNSQTQTEADSQLSLIAGRFLSTTEAINQSAASVATIVAGGATTTTNTNATTAGTAATGAVHGNNAKIVLNTDFDNETMSPERLAAQVPCSNDAVEEINEILRRGPSANPKTGIPNEYMLAMRRSLPAIVSQSFDKLLARCEARIMRSDMVLGQQTFYIGFKSLQAAKTYSQEFWHSLCAFMPVDFVHELTA